MLNLAVFGSGKGSNFQAILRAIRNGEVPNACIKVVISNNSTAGILEFASAQRIHAVHLSMRMFKDEGAFDAALLSTLQAYAVNFLVLAGYMKRLRPRIVETYRDRIVNIHPALLPKYGGEGMYGLRVHQSVVANGERFSGATVHIVDEEFDHGAIVIQKRVALEPNDSAEQVATKVLTVEHEIYPKALKMFAEGRITVKNGEIIHLLVN